jgi:hypothetical protein
MRKNINYSYNNRFKSKNSLNNNYYNENYSSGNLNSNSSEKSFSKKNNLTEENFSHYFNRIDDYTGFFTTQQLNNIDFSKFENHVFLDSAVEKTNYSFKKIINDFPYDRDEFEFQKYKKELEGYTNYILEKRFPKNLGYLYFDGQNKIEIKDKSGSVFNNSRNKKEKTIGLMAPDLKSMTFDFWVNPESAANNQVIFQKLNESIEGYSCYTTNSSNSEKITFNILYVTDNGYIYTNFDIDLNSWSHLNINITRLREKRFYTVYVNGNKIKTTTSGKISYKKNTSNLSVKSLIIGHGLVHVNDFTQNQNEKLLNPIGFVGKLDNFRILNKKQSKKDILHYKDNDIFSNPSLILSLTFNEPSGVYINNNIVLDNSGNKLDGIIKKINDVSLSNQNIFDLEYRKKKLQSDTHIKYENNVQYPVLFPSFSETINLQKDLIDKASRYDKFNPNIFWKMFPKNIFTMSSSFENKEEVFVNNSYYVRDNDRNIITVPENSNLINIIIVWSRFFDQLKMYIDSFTEILNLDYESINKTEVVSMFLPVIVKKMGFEFKDLLPASLKPKLDNKNLTHEEVYSETSLKNIQNELWKRFIINSNDYISAKGTKKSIKSAFNSMGVDYNKFITIREFNGKNTLNSKSNYFSIKNSYNFIDFSSQNMLSNFKTSLYGSEIFPINKFVFEIKKLDEESEVFDNNWSIETSVKFNNNLQSIHDNQSLLRVERNSSWNSSMLYPPLVNLVFDKKEKSIRLNIKEGMTIKNQDEKLRIDHLISKSLKLENVDLFNGSDYYFCVQRKIINTNNIQYELYMYQTCGVNANIKILKDSLTIKTTQAISYEKTENIDAIRIGNTNPYKYFHNDNFPLTTTNFEGKLYFARLWSKHLKEREIKNHSHDFSNFGIENPLSFFNKEETNNLVVNLDLKEKFIGVNNETINDNINNSFFNFTNSFLSLKNKKISSSEIVVGKNYQIIDIENTDFTLLGAQNNRVNEVFLANNQGNRSGKVYEVKYQPRIKVDSNVTIKNIFHSIEDIIKSVSKITKTSNIKIGNPITHNSININYFDSDILRKETGIRSNQKRFNISPNFEVHNDLRCSVDFSCSNFIDKKITNTISNNDFIKNSVIKSYSKFDEDYKEILNYRERFFDLFEEKVDFKRLYQVYKYFDNILSDLIHQAIPSRVNYLGFNFVFESHALERHKYVYKMGENRLPVVDNAFNSTTSKNIKSINGKKVSVSYKNNKKVSSSINKIIFR